MTVVLTNRRDVDLGSYRRVAWQGESVELDPAARRRMKTRREALLRFVDAHPDRLIYGVNVHAGDGASRRMTPEEQLDYARGLHSGTSFGTPLPDRVVRGFVFSRLTNYVDGHAGVSPALADAVAAMLDEPALPSVPRQGNGGAGEIQALGRLFAELPERVALGIKEGMALVNGSPCASALLADAVITASGRFALAEQAFALAAETLRVDPAVYDPGLESLWGDAHEAEALRALRAHLHGGAPERRPVQPPVSFRILPRVLGNARRALAVARDAADVSLPAVSDNPVLVFCSEAGELSDVVSNGGFHNGKAAPCIDGLTFVLADLCQLAQHQIQRLVQDRGAFPTLTSLALGTMGMVASGFAEDARAGAVPSLLPLSGFGQTDVPSPAFHAWDRFDRGSDALVGSLTCLAVLAAQSLATRPLDEIPPSLRPLLEAVLDACPPVIARRTLGPDLDRLAGLLGEHSTTHAQRAEPVGTVESGAHVVT